MPFQMPPVPAKFRAPLWYRPLPSDLGLIGGYAPSEIWEEASRNPGSVAWAARCQMVLRFLGRREFPAAADEAAGHGVDLRDILRVEPAAGGNGKAALEERYPGVFRRR
jgi:hypothetical protein